MEPIQRDDYYAFGLRKPASGGTNKYLYNGKEFQEELEQYDYTTRFYDPVIGRFKSADFYSESFPWMSNYQYGSNSPSSKIDLDGLEGFSTIFLENTTFMPAELPMENAVGNLAKAGGEVNGARISIPTEVVFGGIN